MKRLSVVLVAVIIVAAIVAAPFAWRDHGWYIAFKPGMKTLDGTPVDSPVDVLPDTAQVGLVVYFMAGCEGCAKELQALGELDRLDGLIGTVAVNVRGSLLDVQKFIRDNDVKVAGNNPVLLGSDGAVIANEEGMIQVPYTFLLVKDGEAWKAVDGMAGALSAEQLETLAYYALLAQGEMPMATLRRLLAEGKVTDKLLEVLKGDFFSMPVLNALLEAGAISQDDIVELLQAGKIAYLDGFLEPAMWMYNGDYQMFVVKVNVQRAKAMEARETFDAFYSLYRISKLDTEHIGATFVLFYVIHEEGDLPVMTLCAYTTDGRMVNLPDVDGLSEDELWDLLDETWTIMGYDLFYALTYYYPFMYDIKSPWAFAFLVAANSGEEWASDLFPNFKDFMDTANAYAAAQYEGEGE